MYHCTAFKMSFQSRRTLERHAWWKHLVRPHLWPLLHFTFNALGLIYSYKCAPFHHISTVIKSASKRVKHGRKTSSNIVLIIKHVFLCFGADYPDVFLVDRILKMRNNQGKRTSYIVSFKQNPQGTGLLKALSREYLAVIR